MAVIYTAGAISLAMLERLVQRSRLGETLLVEAVVPDDVAIEDMLASPPPNWRAISSPEAVAAGGAWVGSGRSALLRVPSALVPQEPNYLINPAHPDTVRIVVGAPDRLEWDPRLFGIASPR